MPRILKPIEWWRLYPEAKWRIPKWHSCNLEKICLYDGGSHNTVYNKFAVSCLNLNLNHISATGLYTISVRCLQFKAYHGQCIQKRFNKHFIWSFKKVLVPRKKEDSFSAPGFCTLCTLCTVYCVCPDCTAFEQIIFWFRMDSCQNNFGNVVPWQTVFRWRTGTIDSLLHKPNINLEALWSIVD